MQTRRILVSALLIAGCTARLFGLDRIPQPIQQDELSDVYDGYSIAQTGGDRAGIRPPFVLRGFGEGDYRPPLYAWLAAVPAAVSGFSVAGGRLPSAIIGCVALLLLLSFATRFGGPFYGVSALALAAFSPWLVSFSRVAHEGAMLPPFFFILTLYLWERADAHQMSLRWTAVVGFVVGLSSTAYQSTRLTAPLFAVCIAIFIARNCSSRLRPLLVFGTATLIGAFSQIIVLVTDPGHFFARSRDTLIAAGSVLDFAVTVGHNMAINLGPTYLFLPDMAETYLTSVRLLPVELVLFYPGLLLLNALRGATASRFRPWLYAFLLIALLPAALSNQNPHSLRASGFAVLAPLFSAATVTMLWEWSKRRGVSRTIIGAAFLALLLGNAVVVAILYMTDPLARAQRMQPEITLAARKVAVRQAGFAHVYVENAGYQPYLYFVAFTGMTPREYLRAPRQFGSGRGHMDDVRRIGKYYFLDRAGLEAQAVAAAATGAKALFVAREPLPDLMIIDTVASVWHKYYLMETPRSHPH